MPKRNPTLRYVLLSKFPRFKYLRKEYTRENEKISQPAEIDFCTGCFFGIRTKDFINTHGFDRRYFMYMEDADLSRKIKKKSKIIFLPGIYVYHEWKRDNIKSIRGMQDGLILCLNISVNGAGNYKSDERNIAMQEQYGIIVLYNKSVDESVTYNCLKKYDNLKLLFAIIVQSRLIIKSKLNQINLFI